MRNIDDQTTAISGTVSLAPSLAGKGAPTDTLFVFAREMNGPPMPVSIVRATKKYLPFTFRLNDSTSPMPSRKLSEIRQVVIVPVCRSPARPCRKEETWKG